MEKTITVSGNYTQLLSQLKAILNEGKSRAESAVEREKAVTYWRMGEAVSKHLLENKDRADYGKHLFYRLSGDLNIGERILYRTVQFYQAFPILSAPTKLEWSHYCVLMSIKDDEKRKILTRQAAKLHWTTRELEQVIKDGRVPETSPEDEIETAEFVSTKPLVPVKGRLYTYRLLSPDYIYSQASDTVVDLGFYVCVELPRAGIAQVKGGEIIESIKNGENFEFKYSQAKPDDLYTYKAFLEHVVDGDTLSVKIDCGFNTWIRQKLRLRGIDTPELSEPKGQKAKVFVENALKDVPFIMIKTFKSDKYDRYLADIFYYKSTVANKILEKGSYLNQQLLELGLAIPMNY
jgi:endonuclease YncB( thermonuclease family)